MRTVAFRRDWGRISVGRMLACLLLGLGVWLADSGLASAQQDVGYILGTITDQTGAAVPGAKVTITWQSTGLSQTVMSNDSGFYTSQPLQVGKYSVTVEAAGFSTSTIPELIVDAAARVQANVSLTVGAEQVKVTVEATAPVINTTDAQIASTIDSHEAQELPLNGRNVLALAQFTPGVKSAVGSNTEGFQNRGTTVSAIRIAGGASGFNNNILDGVTNLQDWLGEVAINLKADAVSEYRIMSGVIPAEFGYTSGGVINMITRSGTNQLHGSVYDFLRNDALDSEQSFPKTQKQEVRYDNYGGTLSGPILRNKAFLFGNFEGYQYRSAWPGYYTVPTMQQRNGDFSDLGQYVKGVCTPVNLYDADNVVNGQRQQFAYGGVTNAIDPGRLDAVAVAYTKMFYPAPNNTDVQYDACAHTNNLRYSFPVSASERQGIVRGDYRVTDNDSIVARYAYYMNFTNNGTNSGGLPGLYSHRNDQLETQTAVLSETHTFSPTLLNDARMGLMRSDFPFQAASAYKDVAGQIGLPNDTNISIPTMYNGLTSPNITVGFRASTSVEGINDLTWIRGNHSLHLGASVRFTEGYNNQTGMSASGSFWFSGATTAEGNNATVLSGTGSQLASYMLGQVQSAQQLVQYGAAYRRMMYAIYAQDDWHVTSRLTVNAGLRWDYMSQAVEKKNGLENFDITKTNPTNGWAGAVEYAGVDGVGRNFPAENYGDWGPRMGFAYSLDKENKTILRGGAAIYYSGVASTAYDQASGSTTGFSNYTTSWNNTTAQGYAFSLRDGFPTAPIQPMGAKGGQNAFLGQGGNYMPPEAKDPSAQQFTLTVSRELPLNMVIDVSYLGNHGGHFVNQTSINMNTLPPQYYSMGTAALSKSIPNPYAGLVPGSLGNPTITQANLLKPWPYMTSVNLQAARQFSYWSNLGMVQVTRRMERGLEAILGYTWAKVTDEGIQGISDQSAVGTGTAVSPQNWRNWRAEHTVDPIDNAHHLTVSAIYDLPFGKGQRFLQEGIPSHILSGLQYTIIYNVQSGAAIGIGGANNQLASRPNYIPGVKIKAHHPDRSTLYKTGMLQWFNPAAFINPPDYTFGDSPRLWSNLRGPIKSNVDMSVAKTTHLTERATFQFRIEGFNALNHPTLDFPNGSFSAGPPADPNNPYQEGGLNTNKYLGYITTASSYRNVQLGAKISF